MLLFACVVFASRSTKTIDACKLSNLQSSLLGQHLNHTNHYRSPFALQYNEMHSRISFSPLQLGLQPFQAVIIAGFNCLQWHVSSLGAIFAGSVSLSTHVYTYVSISHHTLYVLCCVSYDCFWTGLCMCCVIEACTSMTIQIFYFTHCTTPYTTPQC